LTTNLQCVPQFLGELGVRIQIAKGNAENKERMHLSNLTCPDAGEPNLAIFL
jgi:hypothetical protein